MSYIDIGITGSDFRTKLNNQLTHLVNVKDYGAAGDGVTNDATAFQNAVNSIAANGGMLVVPEGTYKINSAILNNSFLKNCTIIGNGTVILDFSGMGAGICFDLGTTPDAVYTAIGAAVSRGDVEITTDITATRGDILNILSTDLWGGTVGVVRREMVKVKQTAGGTLEVYTPVYDNYDNATTTIGNLNSVKLDFCNIKIIGNSATNQIALTIRNCIDINVSDIKIIDCISSGITCYKVFGGKITNCDIYNTLQEGFGYGIYLGACQGVLIDSCQVNGVRHGIAMGLCTRYSSVINCIAYAGADFDYPMENHESCEHITFQNNTLFGGGIYLRGLNNNILYNTIFVTKGGGAGIGVTLYGYTDRPNEYLNIIGNKVIMAGGATEYGLEVKFWANNDVIKRLNIKDNILTVDNHVIFFHLDEGDETGNHVEQLIIEGNILETTGLNKACVYLNEAVQYDEISILGGRMIALNESGGSGVVVASNTAAGNLSINNVVVNVTTQPISTPSSALVNTFIKSCHLKGLGYLNLLASSHIVLQNNILENMIKGGIKINAGVATYTHGGNVKINCTGDVENAATATNDGTDY